MTSSSITKRIIKHFKRLKQKLSRKRPIKEEATPHSSPVVEGIEESSLAHHLPGPELTEIMLVPLHDPEGPAFEFLPIFEHDRRYPTPQRRSTSMPCLEQHSYLDNEVYRRHSSWFSDFLDVRRNSTWIEESIEGSID